MAARPPARRGLRYLSTMAGTSPQRSVEASLPADRDEGPEGARLHRVQDEHREGDARAHARVVHRHVDPHPRHVLEQKEGGEHDETDRELRADLCGVSAVDEQEQAEESGADPGENDVQCPEHPESHGGPSPMGNRASINVCPKARPNLQELLEVDLEAGREGVHRPVPVPGSRRHDDVVVAEDVQVMANRLVVQTQMRGDRVRVRGPLLEEPDDLRPVHPAAGPRDEVPQPLVQHVGTLVPPLEEIGTAMVEPSNITIGIVSTMAGGWRGKALGWFLEFRTIPVLLWSYTSVALGTALAVLDGGRLGPLWFLVAMALAGLVQGWETHAINEIFDWRSGTDRDGSPRALSGGSKVRNLGLLGERDLWIIFAVSSAGVAGLAALVALTRVSWLVLLIAAGYVLGLLYTLPPISTAYRPVAGEFLGGFPGVLLAGLGAYGVQTLRLSWTVIAVISAHAFVCTAMLVMHHYLDVRSDAAATPEKRTSVLAFGPRRARRYATGLALSGAIVYGLAGLFVHPAFLLGAVLTLAAAFFHART